MAATGASCARMRNMSNPDPRPETPKPLLPPYFLKLMAAAFIAGLLLFLIVWLRSRQSYDFYKADIADSTTQQGDTLPAPLPADVAANGSNASGLKAVIEQPEASGPAAADAPKVIEAPAPAAPPPPPKPVAPVADTRLPTPISAPPPRYPSDAMRRGVGGTVRVKVTVAADGSVEQLDIVETSGNRSLDRAALETLRRWKFQPATRAGQPVSADVVVPISFDING